MSELQLDLALPLPAGLSRERVVAAVRAAHPKRPTPREIGEERAQACAAKAEVKNPGFAARAKAFVLSYLAGHGRSPGEEITTAAEAAGICAHDARAWGGVFSHMSSGKNPSIKAIRSDLRREKGHGTSGGKLWTLVR